MPRISNERTALLRDEETGGQDNRQLIEFSKDDPSNPRAWSKGKKLANIAIIASMAVLSPLARSIFAPGIRQIAESLKVSENEVVACQTGFVVMLGVGPLILAPLSETFGRKPLYLICFTAFTLLQIPTALAKTLPVLITLRTFAGFFGSVAISNGGGTISDMYQSHERAGIFGWYLLGPLLGPSIGPLLGGIILSKLDWPWLFWVLLIICSVTIAGAFVFLKETYTPVLLAKRKQDKENADGGEYYFDGEDVRPLKTKLASSIQRPLRILFTQPIVLIMASYQALIFATNYSLYTQFQSVYGDGYGFSILQVGLIYLGPGLGFLTAVWFIVPKIDVVYNRLSEKHRESKPEFRLPIANIGSILIPVSIFWFAWTVEYHVHWFVTILSTFFYGIGQVAIFNSTQNYYIDSFENYAASAIAAGALFRSIIGGVVPLFTPTLVEKLGFGWGMSVFAFLGVLLAPSPILFYYYGGFLREKFAIELD
ncbi:MFS general substrate transporter [Hyaloscypha variabilis F]|uniref:MFS general substrate transporter n=1 Tax=Hyaloscypha variabilis (strain UAMH 11265 / GT02V1 / F) TaxID=1149755 RepID=A0A2J6RNN0_HYAVF|nr:MFS general substrate transporter [Hyaloscypha variabilis F]